MNGCEHSDMSFDGRCTDCGEQIVMAGQVPVRRLCDPDNGVSGNAGCVHGDGATICGDCGSE